MRRQKEHYTETNWSEIVADIASEEFSRRQRAMLRACDALEGFIVSIMNRDYSTYQAKEDKDLIQSGKVGVMKSLHIYNPEKGMPTTFFEPYIKHEMQKWLNKNINQSTIHYQTNNNKIQAAIRHYEKKGEPWTIVKISEHSGVPISTIKNTLAIVNRAATLELNEEIRTGNGNEVIVPESYRSPENECIVKETNELIYASIEKYLNDQEKFVIYSLFGLQGFDVATIKEVAKKLEVTPSTVKAIQRRALKKLGDSKLGTLMSDKYDDTEYWLEDDENFFPDVDETLPVADFDFGDAVPSVSTPTNKVNKTVQ